MMQGHLHETHACHRACCILGIESSCDETAAAIYSGESGPLAHRVHSQIATHRPYGGVVPELASRDHVRYLLPLVTAVLDEADLTGSALSAIAYTAGPGLAGGLLVGASLACGLGYAWDKPVLGLHHMESHCLVAMMADATVRFPFLALLVSGGHTLLLDVRGLGDYHLLGESLDDAVGEAFDKTAKLLGLGYPGGAALSQLARKGDRSRFCFPRPLLGKGDCHFSFSGLKTAVRRVVEQQGLSSSKASAAGKANRPENSIDTLKADIAASFEQAVVDILVAKVGVALKKTGHSRVVLAGGVAANTALRQALSTLAQRGGFQIAYPPPALCTDNALMVAYNGYLHWQAHPAQHEVGHTLVVKPRWPLGQEAGGNRSKRTIKSP